MYFYFMLIYYLHLYCYYYNYRLNEDMMIQYIYDITPTSNSANAAMWQDYKNL